MNATIKELLKWSIIAIVIVIAKVIDQWFTGCVDDVFFSMFSAVLSI